MKTKFYNTLVLKIIPYIRFSLYYTSIRGWKYYAGYQVLEPGDIILGIDRNKLTTLLITGHLGKKASTNGQNIFTHAAVCVDKGSNWEISEMTHTNYTKSTFFDVCKEADRVVIIAATSFDPEYRKAIVEKCKSFQDSQYDTGFVLDSQQQTQGTGIVDLACSELAYESDFERRLGASLEDVAGIGRQYITPTGLFLAKNVIVKWDSDKEEYPFGPKA